jgi:hypothetical protein
MWGGVSRFLPRRMVRCSPSFWLCVLTEAACSAMALSTSTGLCTSPLTLSFPTVWDNCNCTSLVQSSGPTNNSLLGPGFYLVGYTASDDAGLWASCNTSVTVTDDEPPVLVCPTIPAQSARTGSCDQLVTVAPQVSDNCPNFVVSAVGNLTAYPVGSTQVNFSVVDAALSARSCSTWVTVVDDTPPSISEYLALKVVCFVFCFLFCFFGFCFFSCCRSLCRFCFSWPFVLWFCLRLLLARSLFLLVLTDLLSVPLVPSRQQRCGCLQLELYLRFAAVLRQLQRDNHSGPTDTYAWSTFPCWLNQCELHGR